MAANKSLLWWFVRLFVPLFPLATAIFQLVFFSRCALAKQQGNKCYTSELQVSLAHSEREKNTSARKVISRVESTENSKALCFQVDLLSVRLLWHWISCERFDIFSSHEKWNQFNAILWTCFFSLYCSFLNTSDCVGGALKWRRIAAAIWISRTRSQKIDIMWSIWIPDAKVRLVVQMLEINDPPIPASNTLSLFFWFECLLFQLNLLYF